MIYVLELPEAGAPNAWFAYDDADFARKVAASDPLARDEIHDTLTVRELLAFDGAEPDAALRAAYPALCALGDAYGWDATLYRADYVLGRGVCGNQPVTLRDAAAAALAARGAAIVYWTDDDALAAFEGGDPRVAGERNWRARRALYEQLVALDVLADDN
ncbi:hypothetical protein WJ24_08730 [Burkholderia vietnamiensis]|uniref:hypothetical protein n=1 Tax=Burkholderia vietnamiensis TaxID=60552 RepID=UPI00075A77E2|nr:hypothetical protein [Burkholderia vietnamiensis]KVE96448.1 hypothetical protein WJ01_10870 [Burkholderia vietnamiensis]KVG11626.1 hypothetical protein WJ24_08730 [Burkholderia vietnamiensis]MBR8360282.1 hypothetical protein [Burkholderia vietnamiensis]